MAHVRARVAAQRWRYRSFHGYRSAGLVTSGGMARAVGVRMGRVLRMRLQDAPLVDDSAHGAINEPYARPSGLHARTHSRSLGTADSIM